MKIAFAPLARNNLREIQAHLAASNIGAAARATSEIRRTIETSEASPLIGQTYQDEVRQLVMPHDPYVIFYEFDQVAELIKVLTIQHAHRLPPSSERTIGDDPNASRYIAYLLRRYNEFAKKEYNAPGNFNFKAISQNLESRYRSHWKLLPSGRFQHICLYLQRRIDRTKIAQSNSSKGRASYRSYPRFLLKSRDLVENHAPRRTDRKPA